MGKEKLVKNANKLDLEIIDSEIEDIVNYNKVTLEDEDGYLYYLSADNLYTINRRNTRPAIFFNRNPYSYENIKNYLCINKINITLLTKTPKNAIEKLVFNCPIHGNFNKSWNEIKNGHYCPECGKERRDKSRRRDFNTIKQRFKELNYELLTENYINNLQPLEYICSKHKEKGVQTITWGSVVMGKGCNYCGIESARKKQTKSHEQFIKEVESVYGQKFDVIEEYKGGNTKIKIYCTDCDTEFSIKPSHLLDNHVGCHCKSKSVGEDAIRKYLKTNDVSFSEQYRFEDCRNKKPLPFDFAIYEKGENNKINFLIEYQGIQHYTNTGWKGEAETSEKHFAKQQKHDNIKRKYCQENNIELLEIPYWDFDNIENILNEKLNNFKEDK